MTSQKNKIEKLRNIPGWIIGAITFITSIVGFAILFRKQPYLVTFITIAVIIASIWFSSLYIILAKTPPKIIGGKGVYKYKGLRSLAFILLFLIPVVITGLLYSRPVDTFFSLEIPDTHLVAENFEFSTGQVSIEQLIISESSEYYRIESALLNRYANDVLIKEISVFATYNKNTSCVSVLGGKIFKISDTVAITKNKDESELLIFGSFNESESPDYFYPLSGRLWNWCYSAGLELTLETSFILPASDYSSVYILIPKKLHVEGSSRGSDDQKFLAEFNSLMDSLFLLNSKDNDIKIMIYVNSQSEPIIVELN